MEAYTPYAASTSARPPRESNADGFSALLNRTRGETSSRPQSSNRADVQLTQPVPDASDRAAPRRDMHDARSDARATRDTNARLEDDARSPSLDPDRDELPEDLIAAALYAPDANRPDEKTPADAAEPQDVPGAMEAVLAADGSVADAAPATALLPSRNAMPQAVANPDVPTEETPAQAPNPEAPPSDAPSPQMETAVQTTLEIPATLDAGTLPFAHLIHRIRVAPREEGAQPQQPAADSGEATPLDSPPEAVPAPTAAAAPEESGQAGQEGQNASGNEPAGYAADADITPDDAALAGAARMAAPDLPMEESPTARVPAVSTQIAEKIQTGIGQGQKNCEIQLLPEHLGRVTLRLAMTENGLSATIRAENAATRNLIYDGLRDLQETLERSGIRVHEVDVSSEAAAQLGGDAFQGQNRSGNSHPGGHRAPGLRLRGVPSIHERDVRYAPDAEQQLTMTGIEEVQGYQVLA